CGDECVRPVYYQTADGQILEREATFDVNGGGSVMEYPVSYETTERNRFFGHVLPFGGAVDRFLPLGSRTVGRPAAFPARTTLIQQQPAVSPGGATIIDQPVALPSSTTIIDQPVAMPAGTTIVDQSMVFPSGTTVIQQPVAFPTDTYVEQPVAA